ncbi:hypothetical protein L1987_21237 [Smallanthus sonchifolius]|uniref:Uncharacterized protein n=1 Tax=Smallanthus sonchifolius TaxID=185202 RepID=A0ACB9IV13_9ASTR|nr:hypothetical protein L1987_21237 [Smallanthus sonchifolius]
MPEKPCRILMDLAGPKLRTGKMKPGPCVMKISPKKNAYGNMITTTHVWVAQKGAGPPPPHVSPDAVIYVDGQDFLTYLEIGDAITFSDARGKQRRKVGYELSTNNSSVTMRPDGATASVGSDDDCRSADELRNT